MNTSAGKSDNETSVSNAETEDTPVTKQSKVAKATSMLTRSKAFKKMVIKTFHDIDVDNSGTIDREELYTGLLLIHLKLATYVGPAATKVLSREQVYSIFDALDMDSTGSLNEEQFMYVMTILCSQIASRIAITTGLTLFIIPFMTRFIVAGVPLLLGHVESAMLRFDVLQAPDHLLWRLIGYIPKHLRLSLGPTISRIGLTATFIPLALAKLDILFGSIAIKTSKKLD